MFIFSVQKWITPWSLWGKGHVYPLEETLVCILGVLKSNLQNPTSRTSGFSSFIPLHKNIPVCWLVILKCHLVEISVQVGVCNDLQLTGVPSLYSLYLYLAPPWSTMILIPLILRCKQPSTGSLEEPIFFLFYISSSKPSSTPDPWNWPYLPYHYGTPEPWEIWLSYKPWQIFLSLLDNEKHKAGSTTENKIAFLFTIQSVRASLSKMLDPTLKIVR